LVQLHTERCELFLEPLLGTCGPASLRVVSTEGDDDIIGEPMIVHRLVGSLCRFLAYRVEGPIQLVQVDVRRQRAERSPLWNTDLASNFDDLLHEMQHFWVLDSLRDLV